MTQDRLKITIIGAGNVGTHLAMKLHAVGYPIEQVFSRKRAKAKALADKCESEAITELKSIRPDADLYLIAIPDDALPDITSVLQLQDKVAAHTSGAASSSILEPVTPFCGVMYPMQSFTRTAETPADFAVVVHSEVEIVSKILGKVARSLTDNVLHLDDKQRLVLHVAAVLVNNFPNHLYVLADKLLASANVSFDVMFPLLMETTRKALSEPPITAQTGPAKRSDFKTIQAHLDLLNDQPSLKDIYLAITESIIESEKNRAAQ